MTASLLLGNRIDQYTFTCQKLLLIGTTVDTVAVLTLIRALTIINKAEVRIRWYIFNHKPILYHVLSITTFILSPISRNHLLFQIFIIMVSKTPTGRLDSGQ